MPTINDTIIFEDPYLLAINKPAGYLAETHTKSERTLVDMISDYLSVQAGKTEQAYAVHRLDRRVSGLLLFAKTPEVLAGMITLFKQRKIKKTYWAIVHKAPPRPTDELVHWLTRDRQQNITYTHTAIQPEGKKAILAYKTLAEADGYYLLEVYPYTGRTHQIRAQLAAIGCPIVGDYKYGYPREMPRRAIALHAKELRFEHPITQQPIHLSIDKPPAQLWNVFPAN